MKTVRKNLHRLYVLFLSVVMLYSCSKEDAPQPVVKPTTGLYVLCEGTPDANNSKLGFYDFSTGTYSGDFYSTTNQTVLGSIANNAVIYGAKIYIAVDNSGIVNVLNAGDGKLIKSISFKDESGASKGPRRTVPFNGKIYVPTIWGKSLEVIDTSSLEVTQSFSLRSSAEDVAFYNDQAFVVLQGNYKSGYDSTIAVLNAATGTEVKKINVGVNPGRVCIDNQGNLFIPVIGDYDKVQPFLAKVDANGTLVKKVDGSFDKMAFYNNQLYILSGYNGFTGVRIYDPQTMNLIQDNFIKDGTTIKIPYGISIDELNGDVYVTDAIDYTESGKVFAFDKSGKLRFSFTTTGGIGPNTVLFKR
ncbi:hypothetical protein A8C56_12020 [Niabella ginsenosidivorans]|uniref:SMP-30/Gluconolactonase/LRE-like region domain-containing protein n=1 Tax=Niabella ginsenosidivorans TaxID=1176587 RepID=A0A1A9I1V4_9BACT|nr:DUF5074 domain-containing protein [Niabella ginsenosidivorans]ANH81606.1 hypothetical protein A8C56_12020 [Niabella ginsenosidivorans]